MSTAVHTDPDAASQPHRNSPQTYLYSFRIRPLRIFTSLPRDPRNVRPGTERLFAEILSRNRIELEFTAEAFQAFRKDLAENGIDLFDIQRALAVPQERIE